MKELDKIGIMLSLGYSKKEVAQKTGKSVNTVDNQTQSLYRETGSHNLADITRYMISRYSGIPSEDILIHALHDITVGFAMAFMVWVAFQPEVVNKLNEMVTSIFNCCKNFN